MLAASLARLCGRLVATDRLGSSLAGRERAGPATQVHAGMALMDYATCNSCRLSMEWRYTSHGGSEVEVERQNLQDAALVLRGPKTNRACIHAQPTHVRKQSFRRCLLAITARHYAVDRRRFAWSPRKAGHSKSVGV